MCVKVHVWGLILRELRPLRGWTWLPRCDQPAQQETQALHPEDEKLSSGPGKPVPLDLDVKAHVIGAGGRGKGFPDTEPLLLALITCACEAKVQGRSLPTPRP